VTIFGALADWYPNPEDGWHVGGAIGLAGVALTNGGVNTLNGYGLGVSVLGGYDWWIGPQLSLGVMSVVATSNQVEMLNESHDGSGFRLTPATVSIQGTLAYH
jgi:hypothetical protein